MSINTADFGGNIILYKNERILIYCEDAIIQFVFARGIYERAKQGRAYLTTHRFIFNSADILEDLGSVSFPFVVLEGLFIEHPKRFLNYVSGKANPQIGGRMQGPLLFRLMLVRGGTFEFGMSLMKAVRRFRDHLEIAPYTYPKYPLTEAEPKSCLAPKKGYAGFRAQGYFKRIWPKRAFFTDDETPFPGLNDETQRYRQPELEQQPPSYTLDRNTIIFRPKKATHLQYHCFDYKRPGLHPDCYDTKSDLSFMEDCVPPEARESFCCFSKMGLLPQVPAPGDNVPIKVAVHKDLRRIADDETSPNRRGTVKRKPNVTIEPGSISPSRSISLNFTSTRKLHIMERELRILTPIY